MSLSLSLIMLIAGLAVLTYGADFLVRGSVSLAKRAKVSELAIGLTVVAFGTSTPELIVNILASAQGKADIVFGNIVGSNTFNILVVLGISGLIYPLTVKSNTVWKEIPLSFLAAAVLWVLVKDRLLWGAPADVMSRLDGVVFLAFFAGFMYYITKIAGIQSEDEFDVKVYGYPLTIFFILLGLGMLFGGGKLLVTSAVELARALGVSEKFIALTIIAAGTSLPELATSAVAAYRKRCDIAVGNVVGSNIFNIFFILGVSGVIKSCPYPASFDTDVYVLLATTVALFLFMFVGSKHRLDRWQAGMFLAAYAAYVGYMVMRE